MLVLQPSDGSRKSTGKIGLAIAGGGPTGGMYELGALRALESAIDGLDLTRLDVYVGVSSGAFLAAGLANHIHVEEMCRILITGDSQEIQFTPDIFLRPALAEYMLRARALPRLLVNWARESVSDPRRQHFSELISRFGGLIPNGLFDNRGIEAFMRQLFTANGRVNDFRKLNRPVYVIAVDLDSGEAVRFGDKDWDNIPISKAIQASSALPGLYPPVDIRGRHFVDGALRRTMHASVVLDKGIDLLLGVNPFVPYNASRGGKRPRGLDRLAQGGLPVVLSQTFRTLLQSRVQVGLAKYAQQYPGVDQIVLEPNEDEGEMFFTGVFSYASRRRVSQYAFRSTLADLARNREKLRPVFERHGLRLRDEVLDDPEPSLFKSIRALPRQTPTTAKLRRTLDDIEHLLHTRKQHKIG